MKNTVGPIVLSLILLACSNKKVENTEVQSAAGSSKTLAAGASVAVSTPCPADMVEIDGDYCPNEEQVCLYNTDNEGNRLPGPGDAGKACGEYQKPTRCLSGKVRMHYCIDKFEWPNKEGQRPQDWMSFFDAKKAVESVGKRLCTHKEWTLAAEGPDMHPLPYGDGYHRDKSKCNFDNKNPGIDVFQSKHPNDEASQKLRALLVASGSMDCVSDFGVHDLSGNIDEWVVNESSQDLCINKTSGNCRTGLMGGHIWHVRNASRPMTTAHGAGFSWYETGVRACKDI